MSSCALSHTGTRAYSYKILFSHTQILEEIKEGETLSDKQGCGRPNVSLMRTTNKQTWCCEFGFVLTVIKNSRVTLMENKILSVYSSYSPVVFFRNEVSLAETDSVSLVFLYWSHFCRLISAYNSLTDKHLAGYFSNTRIRRHLQRAGLVRQRHDDDQGSS